jgi:serine/threonine protein kinase
MPQMTIKGRQESPRASSQTLVVQRRAFREVQDHQVDGGSADYDLVKKLGEGGMGVVYAGRQASIDRTVAIKMLKPNMAADQSQRNKFLSEAVITGDLDHPNIVPIYDLGANDEGALFYAMKCVHGTPWDECIRQKSLSENVEILLKVCDAVAFGHSRGIIHRDLKPENTMLGGFGEVLVMDWGLALPFGKFEKSRSITPSASMGGTPAYMAPEMATGPFDRKGPASDIYLLGAILYEIVTGHPPHRGKDVMKCLFAAARNEILPTDKQSELIDIARRAMSTSTEDRYPTVQEFQAGLVGTPRMNAGLDVWGGTSLSLRRACDWGRGRAALCTGAW